MAFKAKLTKEQRSAIATEAAKKRWAARSIPILPVTMETSISPPSEPVTISLEEPQEKHCPACMNGESLEEGEGTHILATVEHPVTLPAAFEDAETTVALPAAPAPPQKPAKRQTKVMPKEFKSASSYAEKRLPLAIKEKSEALAIVTARESEINDLIRVIKALGGTVDPMPQYTNGAAHNFAGQASTAPVTPQLPPLYPEYQQAAPAAPVVTPVKPMMAGGAGVAQGMLEVPNHWYNEG